METALRQNKTKTRESLLMKECKKKNYQIMYKFKVMETAEAK